MQLKAEKVKAVEEKMKKEQQEFLLQFEDEKEKKLRLEKEAAELKTI